MITLQELCSYLDNFFSIALFKDCTINGLQIEGKEKIGRIATAVTASLETIEEAIQRDADVLIVHHGLYWNGQSPALVGMLGKRANLLVKNDLSLLSYHLPLDANKLIGNNWLAAKELGWENCRPFGQYKETALGVAGTFPPLPQELFCEKLENYFGQKAQKALGGKSLVSSAAFISGGAYKYVEEAAMTGEIDCFVTGNYDEPAWHIAKELKINFYACGHSATERTGVKALAAHLMAKFAIEAFFIDRANPF